MIVQTKKHFFMKKTEHKCMFGGNKDNVYIPITYDYFNWVGLTREYEKHQVMGKSSIVINNQVIIQIVHANITKEKVDAIVNVTNSNLVLDGGLGFAIKKEGGEMI
jgi:hypothetical protein